MEVKVFTIHLEIKQKEVFQEVQEEILCRVQCHRKASIEHFTN